MNGVLALRTSATLCSDPSRVVARLFLPGEEPHLAHSRAGTIAARVLALDEPTIERIAAGLGRDFANRYRDYPRLLERHASVVAAHVDNGVPLSPARTLVLGASFTAEYATEAAALCNPSAFLHPDQRNLEPGQVRVAVSLRAIGEGHISSISFCEAVIGPGPQWSFAQRDVPIVAGEVSPGRWRADQLRAVLEDQGGVDELSNGLLRTLPTQFDASDVERAVARLSADLLTRPGAQDSVDLMRRLVASAYEVDFPADTMLAQRTLRPSVAEESDGMEDARFTRFVAADGRVDYRATYTAYDGHQIAPRLLLSADLLNFRTHRLSGPAARNKGMALFPRLVGGRHLALCRTDGESISLTSSADGYGWAQPRLIHEPVQPWELVQVGNCGPPIETDAGWLVLTHGVGPMRTYAISALLLDLDDPALVIGRLPYPLLQATRSEQDGYVPNVVYSCGGVVHDGRLWLPYGIDDTRIGVAWAPLDQLCSELISHR
ncbi:MAG TPA: hypothetical protein VGH01_09435 [Jatrophihabitantaceae bacterium]|jgi:predicted GH43/DUF377 family glycosyl hydrolase